MSARRASYLNDSMLTNESSVYFHESARERVTQAKAEREEEKKVRRRWKKIFQIFRLISRSHLEDWNSSWSWCERVCRLQLLYIYSKVKSSHDLKKKKMWEKSKKTSQKSRVAIRCSFSFFISHKNADVSRWNSAPRRRYWKVKWGKFHRFFRIRVDVSKTWDMERKKEKKKTVESEEIFGCLEVASTDSVHVCRFFLHAFSTLLHGCHWTFFLFYFGRFAILSVAADSLRICTNFFSFSLLLFLSHLMREKIENTHQTDR